MGIKNRHNNEAPRIIGSTNADPINSVMCFSFKYLTHNKNYCFSHFKNENERNIVKAELYSRIEEISLDTWSNWFLRDKATGLETINYKRLNFEPNGYSFKKDEKIYIFRFCNQKYRLIGFKLDQLPVFFVIGYDFDYSAYNHG